jgi:5-methylcytosine-specific restriction endonuclease McrBC GTP-binding regulatory subunit McrB
VSTQTEKNPGVTPMENRNLIYYGAPGTGKSYKLNDEAHKKFRGDDQRERVTFSPDYSYANFVGTYKPALDGSGGITYKYVPGPFMRVYVKALQNPNNDYLLIIEEINRANAAAVFGEVFQLLDRDGNGRSEYPIAASEDVIAHLNKLGISDEKREQLVEAFIKSDKDELADDLLEKKKERIRHSFIDQVCIPPNMYIWATMNNADQGVQPLDTAFKRRWDFKYIGIDEGDSAIKGQAVELSKGGFSTKIEWNKLRQAINAKLLELKVNEDKLIGPFFLNKDVVPLKGKVNIDPTVFCEAFKTKVLMYLFEDAARNKRDKLFSLGAGGLPLSAIFAKFDSDGVNVFCDDIITKL